MESILRTSLKYGSISAATFVGIYACLLGLITNHSFFQGHAVYLHAIQTTWFKDLNVPEAFGFLHNQVTPFSIESSDGESLYAWHILPPELYRKHEERLLKEPVGFAQDVTSRLAFKLLREDPDAILVIHMHGATGTVGSGYRVPNYRVLSAGRPDKIHVLAFDYRGFGYSTGSPSERGVLQDGIAAVNWAIKVAGIPHERILIFSHSLGTAVTSAVINHFVLESPSTNFAGVIFVAPFVDVPTLVATYRITGTIPMLGPFSSPFVTSMYEPIPPPRFPTFVRYLSTFIRDKWLTGDRIAEFVRINEAAGRKYRLTFIHAQDDYDVPWTHTLTLFHRVVNATIPGGILFEDLRFEKEVLQKDLGEAGTVVEWKTGNGVIREEILKYGLHDPIMGDSVVTQAVMRILDMK
ncbi:hypothetical protein TWF481_006921 [Arthrobotrys musiformis]|uniref:AB hydrolase-1 domain-containing protein n=1 Tax=Arthrobotrys musiformis TaxID=47236 RepID=A0AAV9WBZ2_9PEZI